MKKKIKVLHLNFDDNKSGASKAVYRIHSALIKNKINSSVLVVKKYSNFKNYMYSQNKILLNLIKRIFSYIIKNLQNINSKIFIAHIIFLVMPKLWNILTDQILI